MKKLFAILVLPVLVIGCRPSDGGRSGRTVLQNKGSDTLVNVAQAWAEEYSAVNADVAIAVTGGGSGTGISAMINGTADIANASRSMRDSEMAAARERGIDPIEYIVGFDAVAVFLHPDNPMVEMTLGQLARIYGESSTLSRWSELGVTVPGCGSDEIIRISRQNNSGTYAYFEEIVLGDDEFRLGSRDLHGSKDVVDLVENTPCAIGYSGLAYATEHVLMPCLRSEESADCVSPSVATAIDGTYPIARPLFMYTAGTPEGAVKGYMDWVLGQEGQCIIREKGYAPAVTVTCS